MLHPIIILGILTRIAFLVNTGAIVTSIKQKYFERTEVSVSSLTKKGGLTLLSTFYHLRSKVECGGQCMANSDCEAFNYEDQICKLLKTEFLFKDVTPQTEVYVPPTTSPEYASWALWGAWEACRDDRLESYGISATSSSHLCHISGSNAYNLRRRTCQNHENNEITYSRFGGFTECVGTQVSNEENDVERRTCPEIGTTCPRIRDYHILTGGETMDNVAGGCTGNVHSYNGYCTHDLRMYFQDRLGNTCWTKWLFNNARWYRNRLGTNGADNFDTKYRWNGYNWYQAGCASSWGFYVPNKDFYRVFIEHRGTDGIDVDAIHIYWTDNVCRQCGRLDTGARDIGLLDNSDRVELTCTQTCT